MTGRLAAHAREMLGLNRTVAYSVLAKVLQVLGSAGTVLLIVHFLSASEQGYYYTLLSLASMQVFFELGFSFVILQLAAHECAHLKLHPDGSIEGNAAAKSRLASVLQKSIRWYALASIVMAVTLLPLGALFFSMHPQTSGEIAWRGPWAVAVAATVAMFLINPVLSFLEGCGQVRQVAGLRLAQGIGAIMVPWSALMAHHRLYSPGLVNATYALVACAFLWRRRCLLLALAHHPTEGQSIAWRTEVWPFQSRVAISFLCSVFTVQVFTPVLFAFRGPAEAGRMGMSMSIAGYLWAIVMPWISTKATPFGTLIARGDFAELDRLFFRTLRQSLAFLTGLVLLCMTAVIGMQFVLPKLAARMISPQYFMLLLLAALGSFVFQSEAIYLRAHKSEPFLWLSLAVAGLTSGCALLFTPHWGIPGAALTYFVCTGVIGGVSATAIFQARRRKRGAGIESQSASDWPGRAMETTAGARMEEA